jgi:hypothetical protein
MGDGISVTWTGRGHRTAAVGATPGPIGLARPAARRRDLQLALSMRAGHLQLGALE